VGFFLQMFPNTYLYKHEQFGHRSVLITPIRMNYQAFNLLAHLLEKVCNLIRGKTVL